MRGYVQRNIFFALRSRRGVAVLFAKMFLMPPRGALAMAMVMSVAILPAAKCTFVPGALCNGVRLGGSNRTAPHDMLRGKHLVIGELHWPPYAIFDPTKTGAAAWRNHFHDSPISPQAMPHGPALISNF